MAAIMSGTASHNSSLYYDHYSDDYSSDYDSDSSMASTNSTPNKQGAAGIRHRTRDNMDAALQEDLLGRTLRDVSIEDFVKHVYGFTSNDMNYITSNQWTLDFKGLAEYNTALSQGRPENALYLPFKTIMDGLFEKFRNDKYSLDINLASLGHEQLKSTGTPRKPDGLFMFKSHQDSDKVSWSLSKAFLEFQISPSDQRIRKEARGARGRMRTLCEGRTPRSAPDSRVNAGAVASAPDLAPSPILKAPSGAKRRSSDVLEIEEQGHSKRPKQMTRKEAQGAGYALEMMAAACRRWATGFVIRDKTVWVHYYDRIGAIFTEEFDFSKDPQKLAMVALALAKCDVVQAGFEPLISPSLDSPLSAPLVSMDGAFLRLPACDDDACATYMKDHLYSHFQISGNPLYVYQGLNGRGSLVLPGRPFEAVKGSGSQLEQVACDTPDTSKLANGTNDSGDIGIVHGTTKSVTSQVSMVVKLSWPLATRPNLEAEVIHTLRERVKRMRPHLPKVHFAMVLKGVSIHLPGDLFRSMTTEHNLEQRYFTVMIVEQYKHLWEVPTYADFMKAYLDIIECHHAAMETGKFLHRDISDRNLLWKWSSKHRRSVGILNDWDLASDVIPSGPHAKHRTGTGPFMALDLLTDDDPPTHLYRHDLESLFYVLVWAAVHYTLDKGNPVVSQPGSTIMKWTGTYADAREAKKSFLDDPLPIFNKIQPAFQPLRKHLNALRNLFHKAHQNSVTLATRLQSNSTPYVPDTEELINGDLLVEIDEDDEDDELPLSTSKSEPLPQVVPTLEEVEIDFETLGGCLTFENFLAALDQKPRQYR
ncbi:hypothetical protein PLEOSDRAFT_1108264 [Pleurotus ostreatus PC15]|uniref:Fungal-type protein kinase domain-containing protein n=1 Tax=Pleurotus ostreatus (strain PC15) TaxID=1137138 RepID=A0A067N6Y4_PLEO1|nr:hypothetical protein PLEOSDRAFT_1108264 [Pleurotus ostreatus PC15]